MTLKNTVLYNDRFFQKSTTSLEFITPKKALIVLSPKVVGPGPISWDQLQIKEPNIRLADQWKPLV